MSYVVPVKSKVQISQNFVAFSEYMNFNFGFDIILSQINSITTIYYPIRYTRLISRIQKAIFTLHCMCARETMRQYVGVASLVEILYLRLSSLSRCTFIVTSRTQHTVVVEGCQNKKIEIFIEKQYCNYQITKFYSHGYMRI